MTKLAIQKEAHATWESSLIDDSRSRSEGFIIICWAQTKCKQNILLSQTRKIQREFAVISNAVYQITNQLQHPHKTDKKVLFMVE